MASWSPTSRLAALVAAVLAGGCAWFKGGKETASSSPSPFGPTGIPPSLRASTGDPGPGATAAGAAAQPGAADAGGATGITPEEDIVWTNPDDPDAGIPELENLLEKAAAREPWEQSETVARQRAAREGKCLLIWFTDSMRSPNCRALSAELLSTREFDEWAAANLVRLRVDSNVAAALRGREFKDSDAREDAESRVADYVEQLKKRHRVLGTPTLIVVAPHGEVIASYRGFRAGDGAFRWGQLKQAVGLGEKSYAAWRGKLEKRGYREWSDRSGLKVFAKLLAYRDGELLLIEPDGQRSRTHERRLSDADRLWLAEQQRLAASRSQ